MNPKIQWLRNKITSMDLQGIIISNPINIKYLTGIEAEGTLILTRKENIYITDGRYIEYVRNIVTVFDEIVIYDVRDIDQEEYANFFMYCENVGFEENYVTYAKYKELKYKYRINNLVETENIIEQQRMIKDEEEIEDIRKACDITRKCFEEIQKYLKPGNTELEVAKIIDTYFSENAEGIAFETIVASGENSSRPHAVPTDRKIQEQDIVVIDIGCKIKGYCSDMTRTFFIGEPTEEQKNVYNLVKKNHDQSIRDICDGTNAKMIVRNVENDFHLNRYNLIHSLGHGVGLEIHEKPFLSTKVDFTLRENMIITIEPGIYLPGKFGVRIEDTILVQKACATIL
ncbi:MAG: aminopeptidase P family protein [Clostridia bacterium]|nr:aminopeptidase P family protein [Clostridia bacterium]